LVFVHEEVEVHVFDAVHVELDVHVELAVTVLVPLFVKDDDPVEEIVELMVDDMVAERL